MNLDDFFGGDIFHGEPKERFFDIVFNANRNLVEQEIENIFSELVALRELAASKGIDEREIRSFLASNGDKIQDGLNDIYIGKMGDILSQNE